MMVWATAKKVVDRLGRGRVRMTDLAPLSGHHCPVEKGC